MVKDGFRKAELYVTEEMLSQEFIDEVNRASDSDGVEFYSIHTPHSKPDAFPKSVEKTKWFADQIGAKIVVMHSMFVDVLSDDVLRMAGDGVVPENSYWPDKINALPAIERVLDRDVKMCIDVAHLFISSVRAKRNFYSDLETIFKKHGDRVAHLHLCDSGEDFYSDFDRNNDLPIEEGVMDWFTTMEIVKKGYDGVAVVETPRERQLSNMKRLQQIMGMITRTEA